jgi:hypothetical protein
LAQGPITYPVTPTSAQAVQGEANSLRPPAASTAQVGLNSRVHTSDLGSVQAVLASGWLAQADSRMTTAKAQRLRISFSITGAVQSVFQA